ncbi:hypothetical protein N9R79_05105 [Vibrio sp.]|nr:hypothetical protein [Vibrio sp.]
MESLFPYYVSPEQMEEYNHNLKEEIKNGEKLYSYQAIDDGMYWKNSGMKIIVGIQILFFSIVTYLIETPYPSLIVCVFTFSFLFFVGLGEIRTYTFTKKGIYWEEEKYEPDWIYNIAPYIGWGAMAVSFLAIAFVGMSALGGMAGSLFLIFALTKKPKKSPVNTYFIPKEYMVSCIYSEYRNAVLIFAYEDTSYLESDGLIKRYLSFWSRERIFCKNKKHTAYVAGLIATHYNMPTHHESVKNVMNGYRVIEKYPEMHSKNYYAGSYAPEEVGKSETHIIPYSMCWEERKEELRETYEMMGEKLDI